MTIDLRITYLSGMREMKVRPQVLTAEGVWVDDHLSYQRTLPSRGDEYQLCIHDQRRIIIEEEPAN